MNTHTTLHLNWHKVQFNFVVNGEGITIKGEVGSTATIFATPEQLLEMADTIYAQHGAIQQIKGEPT